MAASSCCCHHLRPIRGTSPTVPSKLSLPFLPPSSNPPPLPRRCRRLTLNFRPNALPRQPKKSWAVADDEDEDEDEEEEEEKEEEEEEGEEKDKEEEEEEEEGEEVEEDLPWIQDKALDLVEFTGTVTQAIPGPRVGGSKLPWLLAVPLAYAGVSLVIAFVKTVRRFTSPRGKKKRLVDKNAAMLRSVDELLLAGRDTVGKPAFQKLMQKTGFTAEEILRKYIRYSLNEKPFSPVVVMDLISIRKASGLDDPEVAELLNEISRRTVKDKGPVVMDISGFTEKGFKRKLAVQALFGKMFYLSELPEFCSRDSSLMVKEIFGVADEDADTLRIHTLSEIGNMDSLEKMVEDSDSEVQDRSSSERS